MARDSRELKPEELEQLRAGLKAMALRALEDPDAADDAAQETIARAVQALREGRFRQGHSLGAFARGIARHVIADVMRARGRASRLRVVESLPPNEPHDPLTLLITEQEKNRVRSALQELSAYDHEILRLSYFEGLTPAQIAERLDEPSDRIRKRKSRALIRLRSAFLADTTCHDPA